MRPLRILFNAWADGSDVNAQNLNARDIAIRLDPKKFLVSLFYQKTPDSRLTDRENISLIRVPGRLGSLIVLSQMMGQYYDAIFYMRLSRADSIYRWLRLKRGSGKPIIAPVESQLDILDTPNSSAPVRRFYDEIMRIANIVVANAPYVAQTIQRRYGVQVPVIYSGVDVGSFQKLASQHTSREKKLRIMFAGSFQERKHPELVVEAACHWPDLEFMLLGDGPLKPQLEKRISEYNMTNVTLLATKEYPEYARQLVTADIFLFPSRVEGLPKVTLEAAAAGIPIIVFDDYKTPSVIDGVTGFQVKTFEEMKDRLSLLIENRDLRLKTGAAGAEHAKKFDWGIVVKQWERVFEETISRKAQMVDRGKEG